MWPFLSRKLFPPPSETWLQVVSSDPKAQGWGAWGRTEKTPVGADAGHGKEQEEETEDDAGLLLALLEPEHLAQCPVPDQELEAIKLKLWAMEQAEETPEAPGAGGEADEEEDTQASQLLSSETSGCSLPGTPKEKVEADHRSIYVGNVDYGGTAEELEAYFNHCGEIQRVTILCDKFSGHPKGYAYIEFASERSAQAAVGLDASVFRGRVIKVLPKRTNFPGISSTDRGGLRLHHGSRAAFPFCRSSLLGRPRFRPRGQNRGRGRALPWFSPY
ncbi:embryonic polyadenylate-binding protein 2 [Ochotona curzoniae]|uniref:embryonic polyadenylate-binding protein 2 n=1 Tax=Ochotona curzoniae TaxID=130825 RepID=UPI001B34DD70|nr:embryonic polyadenylate-binding protein 2 [Ochotona curzoniae]